jgi:hypothetical protein
MVIHLCRRLFSGGIRYEHGVWRASRVSHDIHESIVER